MGVRDLSDRKITVVMGSPAEKVTVERAARAAVLTTSAFGRDALLKATGQGGRRVRDRTVTRAANYVRNVVLIADGMLRRTMTERVTVKPMESVHETVTRMRDHLAKALGELT